MTVKMRSKTSKSNHFFKLVKRIYLCKIEENSSTGSNDISVRNYDLENEVKVIKVSCALKLVKLMYLCRFDENPSTGSKDILLTKL